MNASDMVVVARLADHYETQSWVDDPLATAKHDFMKFRRDAPRVWRHLHESTMDARAIGDWMYVFIGRWTKSGMSFKNFAAEWADENLRR